MFWTIAGGVCVGILLANEIIKNPKGLWKLLKSVGLLLFSIFCLLLIPGFIALLIYSLYYNFEYGFDNWGSIPILLKIGWGIFILIAIIGIILGIIDVKKKENIKKIREIDQNENNMDKIDEKVERHGVKKKIIKKKLSKSVKNK